jgi:hypothetical protein
MKIIIRQSVRNEISKAIPELITNSICWMKLKYANVNFENVDFIFSSSPSGSKYYRNANNIKYVTPTICITTRARLWLYNMKTLKIKKRLLFVGSIPQIMCSLIHELTHHVQYELELPKGELLTTSNELEYLKEYYPTYYNKMMGIKTPPLI